MTDRDTWSWDDYRATALEDGDVEEGVRRLPPGPRPKDVSARPKPQRPAKFSRG